MELIDWVYIIGTLSALAIGVEQVMRWLKGIALKRLRVRFNLSQDVYYVIINVIAFFVAFGGAWVSNLDFFMLIHQPLEPVYGYAATGVICMSGEARVHEIIDFLQVYFESRRAQARSLLGYYPPTQAVRPNDGAVG